MPVPLDDNYRTNLRTHLPSGVATKTANGAVIKDHAGLLKKIAKIGNKVILDNLGPAGRHLPKHKATFPTKESDLQYKFHISRLSNVYMTRSGYVDTRPPYTVITRPSFYTSPDELEPPVTGRQAVMREQTWNKDFTLYHGLRKEDRMDGARGDEQAPRIVHTYDRPRSAEPRRALVDQPQARNRPQSAGGRKLSSHYYQGNQQSTACVRFKPSGDEHIHKRADSTVHEEAELLEAIDTYNPSTEHYERVSDFLELLDEFDSVTRKGFIEEIERHASSASLLRQYCGTE